MEFTIVLMEFEKPTRSGGIYPRSLSEKIIEALEKRPLGPVDSNGHFDMAQAAFKVETSWMEEDALCVRSTTLPTPRGMELETLLAHMRDKDASLFTLKPVGSGKIVNGTVDHDSYKFNGIAMHTHENEFEMITITPSAKKTKKTKKIAKTLKHPIKFSEVAHDVNDDGDPPSYSHIQLVETACGKFFLGYCKGSQWFYKSDVDGNKMEELPPRFVVKRWANID